MNQPIKRAIQCYLENLKRELSTAPSSARNDALRDAEEFLVSDIPSEKLHQTLSDQLAYDQFVENYGSPRQVANEYLQNLPAATQKPSVLRHWKSVAVASFLLAGITGVAFSAIFREPPKLSPFTRVDFREDKILVEYKSTTYEWLAIDDVPVSRIVASSKEQFGRRWQKRIAEDLVELLWGIDHEPGATVKLRLRQLQDKTEKTVATAPMTRANRQAVWEKRYNKPPKVSPFTKVEFKEEDIIVEYNGQTYQWLAINEIPVPKIIASSKKQFGKLWQKRIVEDLVEVLWGMEHYPEDNVKLKLRDLKKNREKTIAAAPMSRANRQLLYGDYPVSVVVLKDKRE